jgi:hypothetical protein
MELRCPDCLSPEVGDDGGAGLRCDDCGGRFEREEAFVTVADAESRLPAPVPEELFDLDAARAHAELREPGGSIEAVTPQSDAEELNHLVDTAQARKVVRATRRQAAIHVYPRSIWVPDPLLVVDPGGGPKLIGTEPTLRQEEDDDPAAFSVRVLMAMVAEANGLAAGRAADGERLDRIAAFLNRPGQWNGGDVCEFVAVELEASGRSLREADE